MALFFLVSRATRPMTIPPSGLVVQSGEGRSYYFGLDLYTFKAVGDETGQAYALCEAIVPPQGGSPPHRHHREDEAFYVQEGEVEFILDDVPVLATPGTFLHSPKGQKHCFTNKSTTTAKMLIWVTPAGFERFMAEVGTAADTSFKPSQPDPADLDKLIATAATYGIEIIPPGS